MGNVLKRMLAEIKHRNRSFVNKSLNIAEEIHYALKIGKTTRERIMEDVGVTLEEFEQMEQGMYDYRIKQIAILEELIDKKLM